jgi:hypothetical protein
MMEAVSSSETSNSGSYCWKQLLGNNGIKQLPLPDHIVAQQWDLGSHWSKKDLRSLYEDILAQQGFELTLVQEWPMTTISREHISSTTTYVMWREERLWNVGVLQRVRLSNLVL